MNGFFISKVGVDCLRFFEDRYMVRLALESDKRSLDLLDAP